MESDTDNFMSGNSDGGEDMLTAIESLRNGGQNLCRSTTELREKETIIPDCEC